MLKQILISIAVLANLMTANARQLTPEESLARLTTQNSRHKTIARDAEQLTLTHTSTTKAGQTFYVYERPRNGGVIILGADDLVPALLGYTDSGCYDPTNLPDGFRYWMECLDTQISAAIAQGVSLVPAKANTDDRAPIAPLVTCKWGQGSDDSPFWNKCPEYGGEHAVVGCVATAMAQVMYKHKWPNRGTGAKAGLVPDMFAEGHAITLQANFGNTEYHWERMQDCYGSVFHDDGTNAPDYYPYSKESGDAVALLSYHCGVSVDMAYGTPSYGGGSGAVSQQVPSALYRYFGYDAEMSFENRDCYTDDAWTELLYSELSAERPLYYSGRNAESGHAFVLDGYENGLFHVNWGWHGMCNGYFSILGNDALTPIRQGTGGSNAGYALGQGCIVGVQPAREGSRLRPNFIYDCPDTYIEGVVEENSYDLFSIEGDVIDFCEPNQEYFLYGGAITSQSNDEIDCTIGLKFVNTQTGDVYYTGHPEQHFQRYPICGFEQNGIPVTTMGVPPGEYYIYPSVLMDGDDEWVDMKLKRSTRECRIQIVGEGSDFVPKPTLACSGFRYDEAKTSGRHVEVIVENLSNLSSLYPFAGDIMLVLRDSHNTILEYLEASKYSFPVSDPLPVYSYDDHPIRLVGDITVRLKPNTRYSLEMIAYNDGEEKWKDECKFIGSIYGFGTEDQFEDMRYAINLTFNTPADEIPEDVFGDLNGDYELDIEDLNTLLNNIRHGYDGTYPYTQDILIDGRRSIVDVARLIELLKSKP